MESPSERTGPIALEVGGRHCDEAVPGGVHLSQPPQMATKTGLSYGIVVNNLTGGPNGGCRMSGARPT